MHKAPCLLFFLMFSLNATANQNLAYGFDHLDEDLIEERILSNLDSLSLHCLAQTSQRMKLMTEKRFKKTRSPTKPEVVINFMHSNTECIDAVVDSFINTAPKFKDPRDRYTAVVAILTLWDMIDRDLLSIFRSTIDEEVQYSALDWFKIYIEYLINPDLSVGIWPKSRQLLKFQTGFEVLERFKNHLRSRSYSDFASQSDFTRNRIHSEVSGYLVVYRLGELTNLLKLVLRKQIRDLWNNFYDLGSSNENQIEFINKLTLLMDSSFAVLFYYGLDLLLKPSSATIDDGSLSELEKTANNFRDEVTESSPASILELIHADISSQETARLNKSMESLFKLIHFYSSP